MTPETIITVESVEQPIAEHALDYGIPASLIISRLQSGMSADHAVTTPMQTYTGAKLPRAYAGKTSGRRGREITHDGKTHSVAEWAEITGVKVATIHYRLRSGFTIADALDPNFAPSFDGERLYTHDGETLCLSEWSRRSGIKFATLDHRLRIGMTIGEAISHPKGKHWLRRGVAGDLESVSGTGAGSASQGTPEITFSQDAAE
jgi:hypothetical protein